MSEPKLSWEQAVEWLRQDPAKAEFTRACYYDDPLMDAVRRFHSSDEWTAVKTLLKRWIPGRVLDLGAGRGIASYAFAKEGCEVMAAEPDISAIVGSGAIRNIISETHLPIKICEEYAEDLTLADNLFDIVYGRSVFHHAKNLQHMAQQAYRVIKPGGVCIFTREHVLWNKRQLDEFFKNHPLHHLYGGEKAYLKEFYVNALKGAGFRRLRILHHWATPINYPTFDETVFMDFLNTVLRKKMPARWIPILESQSFVRKIFREWLALKFRKPGDLFTFIAQKPL